MIDPLKVHNRDREIVTGLEGLWRPSNAFLVGSGPSFTSMRARTLEKRGVASMGINNAAGFVRTSAMVFSDPVKKFHHGIFFDPTIIKFCPLKKLSNRIRAKVGDKFETTRHHLRDCPCVFGFATKKIFNPGDFFFTEWASVGSRESGMFTMFLGLRLLHFLGVRRVFLVGVDFNMPEEQHYCYGSREQMEDFRQGNNEKYPLIAKMLNDLKNTSFKAAKFEVYNCNEDSRLSCFPYVPFIDAVGLCRGLTPEVPNLEGWYRKDL